MKKWIVFLLALVMCLSLVACSSANAPAAADKNVLILGTSADYAPFEFMYADENGDMQYAGIDVFVAEYIAENTGKELQVENMAFDYLMTALSKGDYDIVIAAIEDTEDRRQAADFSDPYYTDYPAMILVKKENADAYQTLADFDGKDVGAQAATLKLEFISTDMPGANPVALQNVNDLVNQLAYDKLDAVLLDGSVAMDFVNTNPDLVIAAASDEIGSADPYCVAVQKGDPKGLLPGINAAIAKMLDEGMVDVFVEKADSLSGVAVEVSVDAPEE